MNLIGIQVSHSKWGIGKIVAHEGVCLTVEFSETTTRFIYMPSADRLNLYFVAVVDEGNIDKIRDLCNLTDVFVRENGY